MIEYIIGDLPIEEKIITEHTPKKLKRRKKRRRKKKSDSKNAESTRPKANARRILPSQKRRTYYGKNKKMMEYYFLDMKWTGLGENRDLNLSSNIILLLSIIRFMDTGFGLRITNYQFGKMLGLNQNTIALFIKELRETGWIYIDTIKPGVRTIHFDGFHKYKELHKLYEEKGLFLNYLDEDDEGE